MVLREFSHPQDFLTSRFGTWWRSSISADQGASSRIERWTVPENEKKILKVLLKSRESNPYKWIVRSQLQSKRVCVLLTLDDRARHELACIRIHIGKSFIDSRHQRISHHRRVSTGKVGRKADIDSRHHVPLQLAGVRVAILAASINGDGIDGACQIWFR